MLLLQCAEAEYAVNVDFVLNGVCGPCVPLWVLHLPARKQSASEVKRGVQGAKVKNSEDLWASHLD